ncbi:MAG TPA: ATP-binding protein [Candidatus Limnocylindria bacterium]|nr:ATP-binding protein [Candidatus Limnocylindria bacterium]
MSSKSLSISSKTLQSFGRTLAYDMATATQIKALLQSHGSGDNERFYAVALQLAAAESRRGHEELASEIKKLVDQAKQHKATPKTSPSIFHVAQPQGEAAELLEEVDAGWKVKDLILPQPLKDRILRILEEQQHLSRLKEYGLRPRQRLLFTGPPGCGKTMTASALANDLCLPLFVVRLDSLITRYLGESLSKLRIIFETVDRSRAVYLFDEFDSIGYTRDFTGDVGEMRRLLNTFLTFIEKLSSNSLIVAATNHGDRLDKALYRRFDDLIEFGLPEEEHIWETVQARLTGVPQSSLERAQVLKAAKGLSYSEITRACEEAIKEMLLRERSTIRTNSLVAALTERRLFLNH